MSADEGLEEKKLLGSGGCAVAKKSFGFPTFETPLKDANFHFLQGYFSL
jgi:hypothetical protein